ncbi:hypothetical protein [Planctomicrobium sp. SH664]|uniref:hypothetical protein n=1 Tax=Planctomicrobium sp. SH664 TaxID=3448125 RepID=UPI003F5CB819
MFWKFPTRGAESLQTYVRLGLGGEILTPADQPRGLLVLDGTWRLAAKMEPDYAGLPIRSLLDWKTAYPRVSKLYDDPSAGLATIEAIYAAHAQLGRPVEGLLDDYRWGEQFLKLNAELIQSLVR